MLLGQRREVLAGFDVLEEVFGLARAPGLGGRVGALRHRDQDVAGAYAFALLELSGFFA